MLIVIVFVLGYLAIVFEHPLKINKTATALITGVLCWVVYIFSSADHQVVDNQLTDHLGEIAGILFFLLSAMAIVELIDAHDGFDVITAKNHHHQRTKTIVDHRFSGFLFISHT